jgi:hypothetical protein
LEQDQVMNSAQHIIAALSALALLLASFLQSRKSLARAEEKVIDADQTFKDYFAKTKWWPLWLRGPIPSASSEAAKDAEHLVHVARLWELIIVGSVLAFGAEIFDLLIDANVLT